jgi:hypothetical protein
MMLLLLMLLLMLMLPALQSPTHCEGASAQPR